MWRSARSLHDPVGHGSVGGENGGRPVGALEELDWFPDVRHKEEYAPGRGGLGGSQLGGVGVPVGIEVSEEPLPARIKGFGLSPRHRRLGAQTFQDFRFSSRSSSAMMPIRLCPAFSRCSTASRAGLHGCLLSLRFLPPGRRLPGLFGPWGIRRR